MTPQQTSVLQRISNLLAELPPNLHCAVLVTVQSDGPCSYYNFGATPLHLAFAGTLLQDAAMRLAYAGQDPSPHQLNLTTPSRHQ